MEYTEILEKQILGRLRVDNPWWTENQIESDYKEMTPRLYLDIFYPLITETSIKRAVILMGPRRVGKTVMIYHTIQRLISNGISPRNIIYISVETPIYNNILLEQLFNLAKQALGKPQDDMMEKYFVFFDEIQYLKNWEVNLKTLVDTYRNVKFVASGSAAAELKKRSDESGAGRFTDFSLPPLLFYEYVHLRKQKHLMIKTSVNWYGKDIPCYNTFDINKTNELFLNYINYGGYPEVVFSPGIQENPGQYIRHDIIDKVLLRDLPSLYGITDVQELNSLFTMLAYHSGMQLSYESLAQESGVKKDLLRKYISYLEAAFLVKVIHKTNETARSFKRESNFKIYLTNPSLRCALFEPIKDDDDKMGDMVETAIYAQWIPRLALGSNVAYANWRLSDKRQGEVDLVGINLAIQKPDWAVEIKWSDRFFEKPDNLKSLSIFMKKNNLTHALVTTKTASGDKETKFGNLKFMPVACYAYTVGENTLMRFNQHYGF
jgi:predicted AAA+ superfamily ATPase